MSDFERAERLRGVERNVEQSKNILIGLERSERRRGRLIASGLRRRFL
jgi:hypothetical protein